MNYLNDEIKHTVIKFADSIKLRRCMKTGEDSIEIQSLCRQFGETNKVQFSGDKCNILQLSRNHQLHKYKMGNS